MSFRRTHKQLRLSFLLQYTRSSNWRATMAVEFLAAAVIRYRICRSALPTEEEEIKKN